MTISNYIHEFLEQTTISLPRDEGVHIGLPHPYVCASSGIFNRDQYYWDSYFIILGLLELGEIALAKGMVDNFSYLYQRFAIMPMRNRWANLGISQAPYFTSMIGEVYQKTQDTTWLQASTEIAEREQKDYWMDTKRAERHLVYKGLSRYADHHLFHITAEDESGWDTTSRFFEHCLDYLPIDLNVCLYKYETDLAAFYQDLQQKKKEQYYLQQAEKRKRMINALMWQEDQGFFFDYNYKKKQPGSFYSLAGFYPLWAKLASQEQAEQLHSKLSFFEYEGGLVTSQKKDLRKPQRQWDYPNGWANLHWIVIQGLVNYGYIEDAARIARKWLRLNEKVFAETGKLWEKYDVVKCTIGRSGHYKTQPGFGWTNMLYVKLQTMLFNDASLGI
jgi:alpha,alpha-trehalase